MNSVFGAFMFVQLVSRIANDPAATLLKFFGQRTVSWSSKANHLFAKLALFSHGCTQVRVVVSMTRLFRLPFGST